VLPIGYGFRTFKTLNYELGSGQRAILQIILHPAGEKIWLAGVYVQPMDRLPAAAHAFSLKGKGAIRYLWLTAMLIAVAFVLILRTRGSGSNGYGQLDRFSASSPNIVFKLLQPCSSQLVWKPNVRTRLKPDAQVDAASSRPYSARGSSRRLRYLPLTAPE
jgi:hypothetical protein